VAPKKRSAFRLEAIKELIKKREISDQKQLVELLTKHYQLETNQAVVSRDLRNLGIIKREIKGVLRYELPESDISVEILRLALIDISHNDSIIVIKTHPGLADFVGDFIDRLEEKEILGCIAGENTVFVSPTHTKNIRNAYEGLCVQLYFKRHR
jgi:transcriptional regulator of arginine metabolism